MQLEKTNKTKNINLELKKWSQIQRVAEYLMSMMQPIHSDKIIISFE